MVVLAINNLLYKYNERNVIVNTNTANHYSVICCYFALAKP